MNRLGLGLTNAQKGLISAVISSMLSLAVAFGLDITAEQTAAIVAFTNAFLGLWIGLTAGGSPALAAGSDPLTSPSRRSPANV